MKITVNGKEFDCSKPIDISIPMKFDGPQPNAYGVEPASAEACEYGDLVGDTRRGGSCNFERIRLIPHCNGTHTECVGHVTKERISVRNCLRDALLLADLVSIRAERDGLGDEIISRRLVEESLAKTEFADGSALIIRTLPNDDAKLTRQYGGPIPPYFSPDAMRYIVERGYTHLLTDLPSIDRIYDEGNLTNHRIFWNMDLGSTNVDTRTRNAGTITELIYVPDRIEDGRYLLNIQIAPFESDASPSRPLLFKARN